MHRTVEIGILSSKFAEVNGTKTKSLRYRHVKRACKQKKSQARNFPYSALNSFLWVFSADDERYARVHGAKRKYDFATVDFREELCYHSRPKKRKFKRCNERQKPMKESHARRKKRQPFPKRFSGDGSVPPRFRFGFPCCLVVFFVACAWLRRAQRAALVYAKHTPRCHINFLLIKAIKKAYKH